MTWFGIDVSLDQDLELGTFSCSCGSRLALLVSLEFGVELANQLIHFYLRLVSLDSGTCWS